MEFTVDYETARRVGEAVIRAGWLRAIRQHLGMSGNAMAAALNTYPATYRSWENTDKDLRHTSTETIGRFYFAVLTQLALLEKYGWSPADLVPLTQVAIQSGTALSVVQRRCEEEQMRCLDLGPLGVFVPRTAARVS